MKNLRLLPVAVIALVAMPFAGKADDVVLQDGDGPCQAIWKFASDRLGTAPKLKLPLQGLGFPCELASNQNLNFLVATIPNPIDTHLQLWFDRAVESIQSAAGYVGFRFQGAWIPWDSDLVKEEPDIDKRKIQQELRRFREKEPGVLLFRAPKECAPPSPHSAESACRDLVVFLVPETPTGGVAQDVFHDATEIALKTSSTLQSEPNFRIPVLGPSFSGSFSSLEKIMEQHCDLAARLRMISGTAASSKAWEEAFKGTASSYNATVHTVDDQIRTLRDHMENVLDQRPTIALVTESETASGWHFADQKTTFDYQTIYRYPRGISRLRNAYGDQELKAVVGAQEQTPAFRKILGFRLFDIGPSTDSTPTMARNQTPLSQDAVLEEIARTMKRDRITLAGIFATDVFDALFIVRYLRDACPGIRLFTFDSDLLYEKAAEDFPFDGTLAISTYPLIPSNQSWTGLHRTTKESDSTGDFTVQQRVLFPSRGAEGIYNAMRMLLVRSDYVLSDMKEEQLAEYFDPTTCRADRAAGEPSLGCVTPPVWLTVITRSGYWPLAAASPPVSGDPEKRPTETPASKLPDFLVEPPQNGRMVSWASPENKPNFGFDAVPRIWRNVFLLMVLVMGWYFLCQLLACASNHGERQGFAHLNLWPQEEGWLARLCYLFVCSFSLLAMYGIYILPLVAISISSHRNHLSLFFPILAEALFVVFLTLAFSPLLRFRNGFQKSGVSGAAWPDAWHYCILALGGLFIAYVTVEACRLFLRSHSDSQSFFMAYRSLSLESGVSPILPVLALLGAYFGWGRVHLKRVTNRFDRLGSLPDLGQGTELEALKKCRVRMEQLVNEPLPLHLRTAGSFALAIGVFAYLTQALKSFEPTTYDRLVLFLLSIMYALMFLTWTRFLLIWHKFQSFLEELDRHPIRFVFSDLRNAASISPLLLVASRRRCSALVAVRDRLRMLMLTRITSEVLTAAAGRFEAQLGEVLASAIDGRVVRQTGVMQLRTSLDQINAVIVEELNLGYWRDGHSERKLAAKDDGSVDSEPSPERLSEEIIAIQYRDYIRYILNQLQNLLVFVITGFLLSMVALHCYPFQSPRMVTTFISVMFLMFGAGVIMVLGRADRDPVLSRICKTTPHKLSGNFFLRATGLLGLPLVTVLGSQFPSWGRFLFSWVQPMLEAMK